MNRIARTILFAGIALAAGFGGGWAYQSAFPAGDTAQADTGYVAQARKLLAAMPPDAPASNALVVAASVATPSVVYIKTVAGQEAQSYFDMFFFGNPGKQASSGSGVVFSSNGYIITNNHVIEHAEVIEVVHQKRSYTAKVVGTDPSTDLALLKVEATNLPAIKIANSRKVSVGEWVLAVGNPFNLTSTVTAGIISAKGRNINLISTASFPIESFIQTDAAINPGNSGGALVNVKGELVGINTAIFSRTGSYTGYGFAVPGDIVKKVVEDLIRYGTVQKAFFGADVTEVDDKVAAKLGIDQVKGVAITDVREGGPAAGAGLKVNDVILKINNQVVDGRGVYDEEMAYYNPGDKVTVEYRRGNTSKTAVVQLTNREGTTELLKRNLFSSKVIGADLETVPKVERDRFGVESGVRIAKAYANGYIRRLGLEEGFIFLKINNLPMAEPSDVEQALAQARGRTVIEGIDRNGSRGFYTFGY